MPLPRLQPLFSVCVRILFCALIAAPFVPCPADAQVRVPNLPVPTPALPPLPNINNTVNDLRADTLRDLRRVRIRQLLRDNRSVLEADPNGAPIVRSEIISVAPTEASLALLTQAGFRTLRESVLPGFDFRVVILTGRDGESTRRALRRARSVDPNGTYDYNHLYLESGAVDQAGTSGAKASVQEIHSSQTKVGLIDSGIEVQHPSLQHTAIQQWGCDKPLPSAHGTAVASLLAGHDGAFNGAADNVTLYAADVYCGQNTGGSLDRITVAFAWLAEQHVPVINVSLVGPRNALLEKIVATMLARGHLIVAAVGNDGPSSPPLYPAAYPGVIGVTGVDAKRRVLIEAGRGTHVYFSAPGSDMCAATLGGKYSAVRGTSFAAPLIAGLLAQKLREPSSHDARQVLNEEIMQAIDLGSPGLDKVYGYGLLGESLRVDVKNMLAHGRN